MRFGDRLRQERRRRLLSQEALAEALGCDPKSIRRWELHQTFPQFSSQLQLSRFFGLPLNELFADPEESASPPLLWHVPYPRNPFFTGREEILQHLHEQLNRLLVLALTQPLAVSGLGGIGKTQIALEYAYQYCQNYRFVFWTNAATQESLLADLTSIGDLLQVPERDKQDQNRVIQAVKQWFVSHQEWLWILDNADDVEMVRDVIPLGCPGHLLLTSRAQALGSLAQRIEVESMGVAEGTLFLLRRARLLAPPASLDSISEELLAAAEAIVLEMDFLPLALDQAGAYIEEVGCSLPSYLELYRTHRKELLQRRGRLSTDHPEPVTTTWSLSFERVEQANPAAAELLCLCAFLEPDAIPQELISDGSAHLGPILGPVVADALVLNEAMEELRKFSLIQRTPETRMLRIHRLVQAVLKDTMEAEAQRQWANRAVQATNVVFPQQVEMATWPRCQQILPQAQVCSGLIRDYALIDLEAASLLSRVAKYLHVHLLYQQEELLLQQVIQIREQFLGPEHPDVALALCNLAELYGEQTKDEQAEPLFQRALSIQEKARGLDHPHVANPLFGLARLALRQGKYGQAESLFQRALQIREQALGPDHPDVANVLNSLGILSYRRGEYNQAEQLYRRTLQIREQALGVNHPDVATVLSNLAILFSESGQPEQAELLYQQAIRVREQALGSDHPDLANVLGNMAKNDALQRKYEQAEQLYLRALQIWEQSLGPDHPNLADALNGLAEVYSEQEKDDQAELLHQRALRIWERTLGSDHPRVATVLNGLANLYRKQEKGDQAELFYQRALHIWEQTSLQHPSAAEVLCDLAVFREIQGNIQEAESLYRRALSIREQVFGPEHPKTRETQQRLAALLHI